MFEAGGRPDVGIIFEPQIIVPIIGLAVVGPSSSRLQENQSSSANMTGLGSVPSHLCERGHYRGSSVVSPRSSRKNLWGKFAGMVGRQTRPKLALFAAAVVMGMAATALTFGFDLGVALDLLRAHHGGC